MSQVTKPVAAIVLGKHWLRHRVTEKIAYHNTLEQYNESIGATSVSSVVTAGVFAPLTYGDPMFVVPSFIATIGLSVLAWRRPWSTSNKHSDAVAAYRSLLADINTKEDKNEDIIRQSISKPDVPLSEIGEIDLTLYDECQQYNRLLMAHEDL